MSYILTSQKAQQAINLVRPLIESLLGGTIVDGRTNLHLVVLNPGTGDVLYEESFGDRETWEYPYDEIARSKARICQRTGMVTRSVKVEAPWLYEGGDTQYVGGVIENGLVIAASGLQDYFDEMICWQVLSAVQALCRSFIAHDIEGGHNFFGTD